MMPSNHLILCRPLLLPPSASGSFQMSQLFASGGQSTGVSASASVIPVNTQDWSPLGWTCWIPLQSKGLSRVFSNTTVQKHQFFGTQLSPQSNSHIHTWPQEKPYHISKFSSFLRPNNIPLYFYTHFVYPFIVDGWLVAFTFWLLWIMLLWTWVTRLSILPGIYPEIELLDHIVILFLIFWGPIIWFSSVAAPFYIPNQQCFFNLPSDFSEQPKLRISVIDWHPQGQGSVLFTFVSTALWQVALWPSCWEEYFHVAFILFLLNFCNSVATPVFPTRQMYWQTSAVSFCGKHVFLP